MLWLTTFRPTMVRHALEFWGHGDVKRGHTDAGNSLD
jgi:hypothetical protein